MVKVAVVTGANKGIGRCVVRSLCKQFNGDVILTSRDADKGSGAVRLLEKEGLQPKYMQLDIEDRQSIKRFRENISNDYGSLDVLVNNAGIMYRSSDKISFIHQVKRSFAVNFHGTMNVCDALFPLMAERSRVVNVSSSLGNEAIHLFNPDVRKDLLSDSLTKPRLLQIVNKYEDECLEPHYLNHNFPSWLNIPYAVSKLALTALSRVQAHDIQSTGSKVLVNACCPGFAQTDMTTGGTLRGRMHVRKNPYAKSSSEAAKVPVHLALLAAGVTSPNGCFITDTDLT